MEFKHEQPSDTPDLNAVHRVDKANMYSHIAGPKGDFSVPQLEELGMPAATTPHRGGESIALKMLDDMAKDKDYTATFEKPNTAPTAFEPQSTTLMSPHLHFGSLSCREFYWRVQDIVDNYKGKASKPPTSLTGQLIFRDMYFAAQAVLGYSFSQTVNNDHCRFIPWHLPSVVDEKTKMITGKYTIDDEEAEHWFQRWKLGITGFPWIDALMRQLKQEGWIHHLGRHAVACFLTRGGCYVDWERGAEVFEEWLLDHETACNAGNWQWLSCTAFYSQYYRCYSPIQFPQKTDKDGDFVRKYVPELAKFDKKYIYEPWKAPIADQKKWGCRVEGDGSEEGTKDLKKYPRPMFDFAERRQICMDAMKNAYAVGLHGKDKKVLDGSWRELFDDDAQGPTEGKKGPPGAMAKGRVSHVDAAGDDEFDHDDDNEDEKEKAESQKRGTKRTVSQGTLDGACKKTKQGK